MKNIIMTIVVLSLLLGGVYAQAAEQGCCNGTCVCASGKTCCVDGKCTCKGDCCKDVKCLCGTCKDCGCKK